jgi:cytochrome b6-f complex iron-sulfur subunit
MERRKFIKACCFTAVGLPVLATSLQSCESIRYASITRNSEQIIIAKSEFWEVKNGKKKNRSFVLLKDDNLDFPICIYKIEDDKFIASLLECTHRSCELNIGGGIYSCPCHGSEFSMTGKVLEGPAEQELKTFEIKTDEKNIYIQNA